MKKILIFFNSLIFILLLFISCSDLDDSTMLVFDQNKFDKNRELWTKNEILNYTFSQQYSSLSIGSQPILTIIVRNRELDTIFVQSEYDTDINIEYLRYYEAIEDAYDFIEYIVNDCEEQINSDQSNMDGAKIDVEYDDSFYYPTKINCIGFYPNGVVGGLNIRIIFSDFEVIQ